MPIEQRVTKAQRIRAQNVAEREIHRYSDDHALWHKHVHNVELDPMQVLKSIQMDENPYTVDYSVAAERARPQGRSCGCSRIMLWKATRSWASWGRAKPRRLPI